MDLTPIYILHTRPYRNTSLLVDVLSEAHGRIALVANSARGPKSRYQGQLQLFTPMLANWSGKTELKTLNRVELDGMPFQLNQQALFCGFYVNELLMRVLYKEDAYPILFHLYQETLQKLEKQPMIQAALRLFEKRLLALLGYGLPLSRESGSDLAIQPDLYYEYYPHQGFLQSLEKTSQCFLGNTLLQIAAEQLDSDECLHAAKRLMRMALVPLLGDKPLHSRALF